MSGLLYFNMCYKKYSAHAECVSERRSSPRNKEHYGEHLEWIMWGYLGHALKSCVNAEFGFCGIDESELDSPTFTPII